MQRSPHLAGWTEVTTGPIVDGAEEATIWRSRGRSSDPLIAHRIQSVEYAHFQPLFSRLGKFESSAPFGDKLSGPIVSQHEDVGCIKLELVTLPTNRFDRCL
jgi:hypothetical protein